MLEFALFISGAVTMVLEITGSRVMAPYFGTSVYVWTNLIGVILGALSIGYWLGGRMADRHPYVCWFGYVLLTAGFCVALATETRQIILYAATALFPDVRLGSFAAALFIFGLPSLLLGMVTPFGVRLTAKNTQSIGATSGLLYALSTLGSIVGTFAAGFFLIPYFGTRAILFSLAAALALLSFPFLKNRDRLLALAVLAATLLMAAFPFRIATTAGKIVTEFESLYNHIAVIDAPDPTTGRPLRMLVTEPYGFQSAMYLDDKDEPAGDYAKHFRLVDQFVPSVRTALMLGAGAFSYTKDFIARHPGATMDTVELDPAMTAVAERYFDFVPSAKAAVFHADARVFLNESGKRYDAIFVDAFQTLTPPFHTATIEAVRELYDHLNDNGVALVNLIGSLTGPQSEFIGSEYVTYAKMFPRVLLFPVGTDHANVIQNIMLVAFKNPAAPNLNPASAELAGYLKHLWTGAIPSGTLMTDDYAPVEWYANRIERVIK